MAELERAQSVPAPGPRTPKPPTRAPTAHPHGSRGQQLQTDPLPRFGAARFSPWTLDVRGSLEAVNLRLEPVRSSLSLEPRLDGIRRFGLDLVEDLEPDLLGVTDPRLLPPRHAFEIEKMPNPRPLLERLPTLEQAVTAMREAARAQTMPGVTFVDKQKGAFPAKLTRLTVWNPVYGALIFERLPTEEGGLKVGDLKRMVYERLMLPATLQLTLSCYGRVLPDDAPLLAAGLANGCKLDLSTTLRRNPHTSLHRLRVRSTALRTRQLPADGDTTVASLKLAYIGKSLRSRPTRAWSSPHRPMQDASKMHCVPLTPPLLYCTPPTGCTNAVSAAAALAESVKFSEHVWFTKEGLCIRRTGTTVLAAAKAKADDKAGTSAVDLGDELVVPNMMMLKGGKGGGAQCFRVQNGRPVNVTEAMIAEVELDPEQMVSAHAGLVGVRGLGAGWGRRGE